MYEGINVQNGGITVDLDSLQKTENGELILDGISSLKVFVENGASYDQTKLEILENNNDVRVSFTDANGNEIFMILKGLAQILLTNQTDNPVFEVFEGPTQLATMTTIDDLEAAAAGGAPAGSDQTANPAGAGDLDGTDSGDSGARLNGLPGAGPFDPTAAIIGNFAPVVFDVSLEDIEVLGEEGAGDKNIITGALTVFDEDEEDIGLHTFTPIEGSLVVTSFNEDGTENGVITVEDDDILVVLNPDGTFEISGDFNDLGLGETATVSFDYFATDIEGATSNVATVTLTIEGTNDIPVVTDVNLNSGEVTDIPNQDDSPSQGVSSGLVGYYDMAEGSGTVIQEEILSLGGFSSKDLDDLTAQDIENLNALYIDKYGSNSEFTNNLASIHSSVYNGMTLIINDGSPSEANSILPGLTQTLVSSSYSNADVNIGPDGEELSNGTLGNLDDTSLDGGSSSIHGAFESSSLPDGAKILLTSGNANEVVAFSYEYGSGTVIYSTMPLMAYFDPDWLYNNPNYQNFIEAAKIYINNTVEDELSNDIVYETNDDDSTDTNGNEILRDDEVNNLFEGTLTVTDDDDNDTHEFFMASLEEGNYNIGTDEEPMLVNLELGNLTDDSTLLIDDIDLDLTINTDGTYSLGGNFTSLAVGETATVTIEYYAVDDSGAGLGDANNEPEESEHKTITFTITGTNDQPVVSDVHLNGHMTGETPSINLIFMVDTSGSMGGSRIELTRDAINNVLQTYKDDPSQPTVNVKIIDWDSSVQMEGSWTDVDTAMSQVSALGASGGTNFVPPILALMDDYPANPFPTADYTFSYFLTDGSGSTLNTQQTSDWETFVDNYITESFAIGIGSGAYIDGIQSIAYPGDATRISDASELLDTLSELTSSTISKILYESRDENDEDSNQDGVLLNEDQDSIFEGKLTVTDDDVNDTHTFHIAENGITVIDSPVDSDNNEIITLDDLDITINPDGTYSIGGDFTELAVGETVIVNVEYYAVDNQGKDGTDGINETSESEHKILSFTITGTNDQPVVENINLNNLDDLQSTGSDIGHIPFEGTPNGFTISFTLNLDSAVTQNTPIIYQGEGFPPNSGYIAAPYIAISNHPVYNQSLLFQMGDSYEHFYSDFSFSPGIDYDIQMVFENGTVNLYVDGNLISHAYDSGDANFDSVPTNNETMFINDVGMTVSNLVILNANGNQINVIDNSSVLYETLDTDSTDTNQNGVLLDEDGNNIFTGTLVVSDDDVNDTHTFHIAENGITVVDSPVDSENNEIITLDDLNITVNPDGTYSVGGDFTELAAGETVTVNVEYYAVDNQGKDGTDGINETSESEHKTLSFTITGTNDQPVVDEVTIDVLESELASNPDNQTLTISTDSQYALGNYVSDDDVNDTHTFARAEGSTISLSINTTNATLLTAIANQDLAYIKSVLAEIVAIPEVTTALTNGIDAIPAIDVQSTIAAFMAAPDIATALAIVNSTFGTVGVTAQLDPVTGLTLSIDDASALEAESLLNVTVNQDGSYEVTSPLFDHLSVDDRVSVSFDYVANDGTNDANGETNVSEANTVTLNIQGSNDQPVVDEVTIDVLESELASNPDNQTLTIGTDSQYALGNYVSDDDVNDTHTFARAEGSTISLSINTTNATLLTAIANQDLAYIKSVLAEIVAIPEVTTALTNGIDAIPAIDVQSTIVAFMAAPDIATALAIVNSTFGTVGVTAQLDPVTGLTLSIDDASALEAESLLNVTVNQDGSYEVTSPLFDHLSVDDRVSVSFDYVANDGTNDANGETNVSEANTVTLNIQGSNDQPVIQSISKIDGIYELNDLITEFPWEEYYYVLSQEDLFANTIISDDDVNDTHTLQLASASILFDGGIYSNNFQYTFDQNSATGPNNPISNPSNSGILEVTQDFLDNYPQVNANVGDFIIYNSEFNHLSTGEKVLVTFDVVANDGTNDTNGETNLSAPKTVTVEVTGTNDQPVVANITLGNTPSTIIYEENLLDVGTSEDVVFEGKVAQAMDEDINNTNPHYKLVGKIQVEQNPISLTASDIDVVLKDAAQGGWSTTRDYEVSSDKFNTLAEGETVTLSFKYKASDWEGFGKTGDANNEASHSEVKTVTITITGTNDKPVAKSFIHDGPANNGQVWENAGQQIVIDPTSDFGVDDLSSIAGYDVDVNDTLRVNSISNDAGDTVTFDGVNATAWIESNSGVAVRINADGKVEYNLNMFKTNGETVFDHLDAGDTTTDTFNFTLIDNNGAVSNTAVATINILGTNDKPVIDSNLVANLTEINEDVLDTDNTGTLVSALLGNSVSDFDDDAVEGIAVTGIDNTNGTWQYSIDGGTSWNNFDNGTSDTNATMLYDSSLVRFVPNEDYYGTADITYHAWDQNGYNLVNGSTAVDITSSYGGIKGTVSTDSATSSVTVDSVQDFIANTQGNPLVDTSKDNKAKVYEVGIDDANDNSETDTKAFRIEFGDDTPGTITFNATQTVPNGLTSGGEAIVYDVSADGLTITAKTQTTDEVVFTLEIDNTTPQTVGSYTNTNSYTMTLFKPIDHLMNQHNGETKYLSFDYDSEDSDGDVRSGKVTLQVVDDVPTAGWSGYTDNNGQIGYVVTETTDANGFVTLSTSGASLNFDGGADGATVTELRFANEVGDKIQTKYVSNNERYFLQSQGEDIVLERTGLDITGKANGVTVFTIVVDEVTGDYTYTQYAPIDHVEGSTSGSYQDEIVNLVLQYTVIDGDGDTATGYSTVRVEDDSPISLSQNGIAQNAVVEESNVGDSTTASLRVDYGADGFASVAFTGEVQGYMHDQLTSGGVPITYDFSIPGKVIAKAGAETVFEVILNADGKTYDVNLIGSLDHTAPDGQAGGRDEGQSINFVFEATDKDGDTLESSLSVRIVDDVPTAGWSGYTDNNGQTGYVVTETTDANGFVTLSTSGASLNFDGGADGATVTELRFANESNNKIKIKYVEGVNGNPDEHYYLQSQGEDIVLERAGLDITGKANGVIVFTIVVDEVTGDYTYTQYAPIDHVEGSTSGSYQDEIVNLVLQYTVTDGDGDTATGYSTVRVEDDSPISLSQNGIAQNAVVEESNVGDSTTASLRVDYGADGFASVAFTGEVQGYMHDQLTSGGVPITYDFSIPGKVIAKAGAETVFEVILNADGKTYDVNLIGSLDHTAPDGQAGGRDEGQSINFVFEATDKDGDTLESSLSVRIIDDEPIASWTAPVLVDEASLNTVVNGQLNFDGGADGAEVTSVFHHWQNANDGTVKIYDGPNGTAFTLTSGGEAVVVTYEDNGMTMIGKLSDDTEVFRLEAQSDGSFTFVQKEAIDHPIGSTQEDDLLLKLKFTVTDADGDTSTSNFGVKITDDTPVADYGGRKDISEADIDSSVPASVTGQLTFDGGEDGATLTDVNFWGEGSQVMVYDGQGNPPIALTSNGEPVIATQMVDVNGVITITAVANTTPVYTLVVQPDGNYEFTLEGPIDHPQSSLTGQDEELLLRYSYTVTDGDGDTDVDYFSINIIDDVPTIDGMSSASTTEADANNDGIFDEAVVTGTLGRINEGADGAIVTEMHISNTADYNNLTSGGDAVTATQVGNVITGAKSDGTVVFTFTYDENGNYTFTQKEPLDHNGRSETLIKLGFGYTITDADGDTASSALIVSIHDDEPIVVADTNSVSEAASGITTKSQISGNILTNDKDVDVDNDDAIEIIGLEMTSPQAISSTVATHTINGQLYEGFHITGVYGNIMVDAKSGEYIYNLYNDRDIVNELSEGEQVNETFSYTITDENGVTQVSTLTINITGTNDAPVLSYNSIEDLINENISGKLLGTLDVEDVDSNINSAGFTITGDDASLVEIRENAGQFELWLKDSAVVDFETNNSLDITVAYADDYSASDSESISIGITDVELGVVENTQNISLITEENIGTIHGYETTSDSPVGAATDTDDSSITKTYQLDPSLAGQFVSISFDTTTYGDGGWEEATATNWADWVTVDDGDTVQQIDADSNATETHNINVKVGAGGVLTLVFDANITGSDSGPRQESVDINNLNINTFVADIALNGVETLSDTNTYSFSHNLGIAYAGETVRVYFDTNTYGSGQWDEASENNTGGYSDYIEVSDGFTSQEIYPADGMNTYYVDAIVDSTGSVNLEFDARITGVNEHLDIDITSIDVTDKTIDFGSDDLEIDMAQLLSSAEDFNPDGSQTSIDEIDLSSGDHILSNISVGDVLAMTDSDNTLKIETDSGDTVKLDLTNEWTATGNIDVDTGLDIYEGVTDSSVKLLIDSLNVEDTNI